MPTAATTAEDSCSKLGQNHPHEFTKRQKFFILIKGAVRFDDRLQIELPLLTEADPNAGAALQELLGEKIRGDVPARELRATIAPTGRFPERPDLNCDRCSSARAGLLPNDILQMKGRPGSKPDGPLGSMLAYLPVT